MAGLSIPEAIKENERLSSDAKIVFAELFNNIKKGQKTTVQLSDVAFGIRTTMAQLHEGIRDLDREELAFLDEANDSLEDLIPGQMVRISPRVHVEVLPFEPEDEGSVNDRRYIGSEGLYRDYFKVGRMLFEATVTMFLGDYSIEVARLDFPIGATSEKDAEEFKVANHGPFPTLRKAWDWFDNEFCADPPLGPMGFDRDKPGTRDVEGFTVTVGVSQRGYYSWAAAKGNASTEVPDIFGSPREAWDAFDVFLSKIQTGSAVFGAAPSQAAEAAVTTRATEAADSKESEDDAPDDLSFDVTIDDGDDQAVVQVHIVNEGRFLRRITFKGAAIAEAGEVVMSKTLKLIGGDPEKWALNTAQELRDQYRGGSR